MLATLTGEVLFKFKALLHSRLGTTVKFNCLQQRTEALTAKEFHETSDNMAPSVTLIASNGFIFGGFTSQPWCSPEKASFQECADAFLFTITNPHGWDPTIFPVVKRQQAMHCGKGCGPGFGNDIRVFKKGYSPSRGMDTVDCSGFPTSYDDVCGFGSKTFTGERTSSVEALEVWVVIVE